MHNSGQNYSNSFANHIYAKIKIIPIMNIDFIEH